MRHIEDDEDVGSMDDWSTEFFDNAQDHDEVFDLRTTTCISR